VVAVIEGCFSPFAILTNTLFLHYNLQINIMKKKRDV